MKKLLIIFLITVEFFVFISAMAGAYALIWFQGLGMPLSFLADSPFHSFVGPGLILGIVVGGGSLLTAIAFLTKWFFRHEAAAVSGFGLIIWIFTEMYIIKTMSWMQILYFGIGIFILVIVVLLQKLEIKSAENGRMGRLKM